MNDCVGGLRSVIGADHDHQRLKESAAVSNELVRLTSDLQRVVAIDDQVLLSLPLVFEDRECGWIGNTELHADSLSDPADRGEAYNRGACRACCVPGLGRSILRLGKRVGDVALCRAFQSECHPQPPKGLKPPLLCSGPLPSRRAVTTGQIFHSASDQASITQHDRMIVPVPRFWVLV